MKASKVSAATQKERVRRIVSVLEERFGVPRWEGPRDPLASLIRTILSQNTNDVNSGEAYRRLTERYPTWEAVMEADTWELADVIRVGGLANQKAARIQALLRWIRDQYGRFSLDVLCAMEPEEAIRTFCVLKGVGIKTISVVLAFACGKDIFPVDTHIHRITRRLGLAPENATPERVHKIMQPLVPAGKAYSFHINLLTFGRTLCHARNPMCARCPLVEECGWVKAHRPEVVKCLLEEGTCTPLS